MLLYENYAKRAAFILYAIDIIILDYLWNDAIHRKDVGTNILSGKFSNFVNGILFNFSIN